MLFRELRNTFILYRTFHNAGLKMVHSCVHYSEDIEYNSLVDMRSVSEQDCVPMNVKDRCITVLALLFLV